MQNDYTNPYAPPAELCEAKPTLGITTNGDELAGRFTRLIAAIIDSFCCMAILIPIQFGTGYIQREMDQQAGLLEQFAMLICSVVVVFLVEAYLLITRGQTIGKLLLNIQIVDAERGTLLPFHRVFVYRFLWNLPITIVGVLISGELDDFVLSLIIWVDLLMIFRADRRCLHDFIAGSTVVVYQPGRRIMR